MVTGEYQWKPIAIILRDANQKLGWFSQLSIFIEELLSENEKHFEEEPFYRPPYTPAVRETFFPHREISELKEDYRKMQEEREREAAELERRWQQEREQDRVEKAKIAKAT